MGINNKENKMVVKQFQCEHCGADGKVTLKGTDYEFKDIVCCPVCGGDIYEDDDSDEIDE